MFEGKEFGLHITDTSIQIIQLKATRVAAEMVTISEKKIPEGVVVNGELVKEKELSALIKAAIRECKPLPLAQTECIVVLPDSQSFEHIFYLPPTLKGDELKETIREKVLSFIPVPEAELKYDYVVYNMDKVQVVFVVGVRRLVIAQFYEVLKQFSQLTPVAFEPESLSLLRDAHLQFDPAKGTIVIHAREGRVNWYALWAGWLFDSNSFIGADPLLLNESLIEDLKRSMDFFQEKTNQPIGNIVLMGEKSSVEFYNEHLAGQFDVPVKVHTKFKVNLVGLEGVKIDDPGHYLVVVGAALKSLGLDTKIKIDLLKKA
jgi:Tfp pilus assembly PilM family ATPase